MAKVSFEVDGQTLEFEAGRMLIEATDAADIHIPRFCYHPKLSIAANCRMCLVDVEGAPKPLPACATPIMDGMKVSTQSDRAKSSQEGTMEFLLINHPLDCPICDQAGECPLQDQSVEFGQNHSRYQEPRRQVESRDIGSLIATWMTRCIHCTRCVRYGEEIAGVMELGAYGRGEHTKIGTFPADIYVPRTHHDLKLGEESDIGTAIGYSVNSEISGNIIDLCPVGALTAKPSKYSARVWEMQKHTSVSPHDCVGANLHIQTLRGEIKRVVPRENQAVNAEWLADRDRFSYEAVIGEGRLENPMIKDQHGWREVSWESAFKHAQAGLKTVVERFGADQVGGLASPTATLEEFFLFQKLMRGLGSNNIDHRLRNEDFRGDSQAPLYPGSELPLGNIESLDSVLLLGSNIRKEQPLIGLSLRQAVVKNGCQVSAINPVDYEFHFDKANGWVVAPAGMVTALADVADAVARIKGVNLDEGIVLRVHQTNTSAEAMAQQLCADEAQLSAIVLGATALQHPEATTLQAISRWIADQTGAKIVNLPEANSAAAWMAGCIPHRGARNEEIDNPGQPARNMLVDPLRAYLLFGVEPSLDTHRQDQAIQAMIDADFVVQLATYLDDDALKYADVLLPIASFAETSGTYINCNGRVQQAQAAAEPVGSARPGWKVLRVMANYLDLDGFDHIDLADVQDDYVLGAVDIVEQRGAEVFGAPDEINSNGIHRIVETPIYRVDATVRRATALQATSDNPPPSVGLNAHTIEQINVAEGDKVKVQQGERHIEMSVSLDSRLPDQCAYIASGYVETAGLSGPKAVRIEPNTGGQS